MECDFPNKQTKMKGDQKKLDMKLVSKASKF